tara:strand:+ start:175 stop:549 length:375 start_codon:yes stop_codon:yes gene_type:complete
MSSILIELPFPPSVNSAYGRSKSSVFLNKKSKEYKQKARVSIRKEIRKHGYKKIDFLCRVKIVAFEPAHHVPDIDNIKKILYDSITSASLWEDDRLIKSESVDFQRNEHIRGKVYIEISPLIAN